jgi:DNA-binding GntR family transcriptional regulator
VYTWEYGIVAYMKLTRLRADGRKSGRNGAKPGGRGSRGGHAYQKLRDALKHGALKPGDRIMEVPIAQQLNVSRTTVRDAIRRLESEGLLEHEPRAGLVVATLDRRAVAELYEMREVLEGTAARLFTRHASEIEVEHLLELVREEQRLQGNPDELANHNHRFHVQIHVGAHNRYLEKALAAVNSSLWLLGKSQMLLPHRAKGALAEHMELARAIQKRDADLAESLARKHVRSAQAERMRTLFPQPD